MRPLENSGGDTTVLDDDDDDDDDDDAVQNYKTFPWPRCVCEKKNHPRNN